MEFTDEELELIWKALGVFRLATQKDIDKIQSNINGVEQGKFIFWQTNKRETYLQQAKSRVHEYKGTISDIVELQKKMRCHGNR